MRLIIVSLLIVVNSCTKKIAVLPSSSVWITYDLIIDVKTNDAANAIESLALNQLLKKELIGAELVFNQNSFSFSYTNNGKEKGDTGRIIKITDEYFIIRKDDVEQKISYRMSSDKQKCDFIFPDGTVFYTERQH